MSSFTDPHGSAQSGPSKRSEDEVLRLELTKHLSPDEVRDAIEHRQYQQQWLDKAPGMRPPHVIPEGMLAAKWPIITHANSPPYAPGRRDIPVDVDEITGTWNIIDVLLFASFKRAAIGGRKGGRPTEGSWENRGDRILYVLLSQVFREQFPDLTPREFDFLAWKYACTDAFASMSYALGLSHHLHDVSQEQQLDPTHLIGAGSFEVFVCMMWDSEMEHRGGSIARTLAFFRSLYNPRVLPHLALDIEFLRAKRSYDADEEFVCPPATPTPPEPKGHRFVYRRAVWLHPTESAAQADVWFELEKVYKADWRMMGECALQVNMA